MSAHAPSATVTKLTDVRSGKQRVLPRFRPASPARLPWSDLLPLALFGAFQVALITLAF